VLGPVRMRFGSAAVSSGGPAWYGCRRHPGLISQKCSTMPYPKALAMIMIHFGHDIACEAAPIKPSTCLRCFCQSRLYAPRPGDVAMPAGAKTVNTPLLNNLHLHYYNVRMEGITVDGTTLPLDMVSRSARRGPAPGSAPASPPGSCQPLP
jgi:hypothetical protein